MSDKELTTKKYWEAYYKNSHVNKQHILTVCSYYSPIWEIFISNSEVSKSLIEIGGFPGRYLAYLANRYNIEPTCLDYNSDLTQIEGSFMEMDVQHYHIIKEDFIKFKPKLKYDYVMSNGFIEHFKNYDDILDLHVKYMSENGRLLVMIPNMKGYIQFYKYLVDYKNLKIHNLKCMKLKVFEDFAERHNLSILHLGYYGGFPLGIHQKINFLQKIIYKLHRLVFKYFANDKLKKYPSKYFSSAIVGVFEKQ
ncbi:class I SAM-dependent methyltransferase [Ichthyenterobacterium sp. W332]|uniref:Class I SAM-dependent methyltransferase n=1 Tax=Microcosmobacter mediterraneus TaxID=3075607 RepID=A0ABU2YGP4_9FLAO|nr:class I SAM-dependent methyltransferase [Ichthyenterobacterium sp. W332]MDT0557346.1 class I SAM-dependent methyltransferase [Ichthyenterobacterium sp. W332]